MDGVTDDQLRALALAMSRTDELDAQPGKFSFFRVARGPIFASLRYSPARTVFIYGLDAKRMKTLPRDDPKTFRNKGQFLVVKLARIDIKLLRVLLREAHTSNDPKRK
jgi:hypothetical protein